MCGWVYTTTGVRKVCFGDANLKDLFEEQSQFLGYIMAVFNLLNPDAPSGLIFDNCIFCPYCVYVFCIYLRTNNEVCST